MRNTLNSLPESAKKKMAELLNARLADAIDLYSHVKQAHWNVKGPAFYSLHLLFDAVAEEVETGVDEIAERIAQLGGVAKGTVRIAAASSGLKEFPAFDGDWRKQVEGVAGSLAAVGTALRKAIEAATEVGDAGTADLFTQISRTTDKNLWFVESHLSDGAAGGMQK